ncbi:MAG TPA: hypothetical protein PLQ35_11885 [bacterium]|nr:hypothetical protein [bacterium]HQL62985.1 hypothetical protein [bacterium]
MMRLHSRPEESERELLKGAQAAGFPVIIQLGCWRRGMQTVTPLIQALKVPIRGHVRDEEYPHRYLAAL